MGNIKKQNSNGNWDVLASGKATGIAVTNPKLIDKGETVESVNSVLEKHQEEIDKLKHNVSWLAKHGGGGSGSGGGSSDTTEATCVITANDSVSGNDVVVGKEGLKITLTELSYKVNKAWKVTIRVGASQIATLNLSFTSNTAYIDLSRISPYLTNHSGNLSISATYEDITNGVYGAASWTGTIYESVVTLSTSNYSFELSSLNTSVLLYNYSVGIVGNYTLTITLKRNNKEVKKLAIPIKINSTSIQSRTINVNELFNGINESDKVGVFNVESVLSYDNNSLVQGTAISTITLISDDILVASTMMSESSDSPVDVSISSSINLVFTAYLQNVVSFTYNVKINNIVVRADSIGYFGEEVNDYIPVKGDWVKEGSIVALNVTITAGNKSVIKTYYIKLVKSIDTFLESSDDVKAHLISEFLARDYNTNENTFELSSPKFVNNSVSYNLTSKLQFIESNNLSVISKNSNGLPYLRISNSAIAKLGNFIYNNREHTLNNTDLLIQNNFSVSICFKADYHPDDDRTILFCGKTDSSVSTYGQLIGGFSIDVHDVYINNKSVAKLTDNTINCVDITCQFIEVEDKVGDEIKKYGTYLIKVYVDGVLTAIDKENNFLTYFSNFLYLGGRDVNGDSVYLCDCDIYNLQVYNKTLSDFDIMVNYINNKVSTNYIENQPNFSLINQELKYNFCERNSDGSINSLMYKNNDYTIDFLLTGDALDSNKLNDHAKVLGIPIMLIDVSTDPNWTFSTFVTQQTAGSISLPESSGRTIQYWDPTGENNSVLTIHNVTIKLQGTSTLADSVKNIDIIMPNDTAFVPVRNWYPEQTYTLKADVVDSSHSNNPAIGKFINEQLGYDEEKGSYMPFDSTAIDNVYKSEYRKNQQPTATLKHTVEGFPILLIMHFNTNESSTISVTPLGIYSFNIGRAAYRNLGFKKVKSITASGSTDLIKIDNFPFLLENADIKEETSNANWIEIKDTTSVGDLVNVVDSLPENFDSSKGDFWQEDPLILDERYEVRFGNKAKASEYQNFKTFVANVAKLPIEGCSITNVKGERLQNQITGKFNSYTLDNSGAYIKKGVTEIVTDSNTLSRDLGFNTDSAYKYFVIALLFGLVDNFGKNSTYRSWNEGQYFIDFYDMDTALKGNNQGGIDVSPALWIKFLYNNIIEGKNYGYLCETFNKDLGFEKSGTVVSAWQNKLWLSLDTSFFRGYLGIGSSINSIYTQYWYQLRGKLEELMAEYNKANGTNYTDFADYFIDVFYINQTKKCGSLLFNYDYRLKYLVQFTANATANVKDISKLHGRKIAIARDWLKKHIAFMDSLFYWRDPNQAITFRNDLNSRAANSVLNTPESLPMVSNIPMIMYASVGNNTQTYYFMKENTKTFINAAYNASNSIMNFNFSNSPNIIEIGDSNHPLNTMNIVELKSAANNSALNSTGLSSITDLLLSNNNAFNSSFSLDTFAEGSVSELRTLDFSNTSGESFDLNLVRTTSDGSTYTKFSKLTSIDVSNSTCVKNITIPTIPLKKLKVANSSITNFSLVSQKYLKNIDLTGCNKLLNVTLDSCEGYTELILTNLPNLQSVKLINCNNITKVVIQKCDSLTSVNIENCSSINSIEINECKSLVGNSSNNYVSIVDCNKLSYLSLANNNNLQKVKLSSKDNNFRSRITYLAINNTKIIDISESSLTNSDNLLDLSGFTNLTTFNGCYNPNVVAIQFANDKNNPIHLTNTFQSCNNLERIYGNFIIHESDYEGNHGMFYGCTKFSIHGTDITKWKNYTINNNGVYKTPWEVIQSNPANYETISWDDTYASGDRVTNFKFAEDTDVFTNTFRKTAVTTFDVYYTLCVASLSGFTGTLPMLDTFNGTKKRLFNWTIGNIPNRYMFYKCGWISRMLETFLSSSPLEYEDKGYTYLCSPTIREDGTYNNNGLFSPLINCTDFVNVFRDAVISKHFFRATNRNYNLTSFSYQSIVRVYDNDSDAANLDNMKDATYVANNYNKLGNFDDFFKNCPKLNYISNTLNSQFINYDSIKFGADINIITSSFNANVGIGTIDLRLMFPVNSKCTVLANSFKVKNYYNEKVKFPIANDTFKNLTRLIHLGASLVNANAGNDVTYGFSGNGLDKYIEGTEFPFNIVSKLSNLTTFIGFFSNTRATLATTPALPGILFLNNKRLKNIASLFYNISFACTLSSEGFINCTTLKDVSYLFAHATSSDPTERSQLTGYIPYHFFYNGSNKRTVILKGTNQTEKPDETFDKSKLLTETFTYNVPITSITNINNCFEGCINLSYYRNNQIITEINPDYTPFKWMYNEDTDTWSEGKESKKLDASWSWDGYSPQNSEYKYLEEKKYIVSENTLDNKTEGLNYMCAPDLLRYCSSTCNVNQLFKNCGLNYSTSSGGYMNSNENLYSSGITGRIPPYLLKPVYNTTSISEMFLNCRCIYSYKESENGIIYQIPKEFFKYAPNINTLDSAFAGMAFIPNTNLQVFNYLTKGLDIRGIFKTCIFGKNDVNWNITNVFNNNSIFKISGAFSLHDVQNNNKTIGVYPYSNQHSVSLPSGTTISNNFSTNKDKIPSENSTGYVYYQWGDKASDNMIKSTNNNY